MSEAFRHRFASTVVAGAWTQPAARERPAGVAELAALAHLEGDAVAIGGSLLTVRLEGTIAAPDADDAAWTTLATATLDAATRWARLGSDGLLLALPFRWLRVRSAHDSGSPTASVAVLLDADRHP